MKGIGDGPHTNPKIKNQPIHGTGRLRRAEAPRKGQAMTQRFQALARGAGALAAGFWVVVFAVGQPPGSLTPLPSAPPTIRLAFELPDLERVGLGQNPRLGQGAFAVDAARGRAIQAGLYPNPLLTVTGDEMGDITGPGGIWTAPQLTQEVVTGGKLRLSQDAAQREVDQAALGLTAQRYAMLANIRAAYYDALSLQRRAKKLEEVRELVAQSVAQAKELRRGNQIADLDVIQLEVEEERVRTDEESLRKELPAAYQRLASAVGVPGLPIGSVIGDLEAPLPPYELERLTQIVPKLHPEAESARVGVLRAETLLRRAQVEPIPNLLLTGGYVRQNQNRSDDWMIGVSIPLPIWNRNQGNIFAAQAQVGEANLEVPRVENDLVDRTALSFREFAAARERAFRLRQVKAKAEEAYKIVFTARATSTLQKLESQRTLRQAEVEYLRALGDAWKAAAALSGLTLEDQWPPVLAAQPLPAPAPAPKP